MAAEMKSRGQWGRRKICLMSTTLSRAVLKALDIALPWSTGQFVFAEMTIGVPGDRCSPERLSGKILEHLADFPVALKLIEYAVRKRLAHTRSAIFFHHKKLLHPVTGGENLDGVANQREAGISARHGNDEGVAVGARPIAVQRVSEFTVHIDVLIPDV